MSSLLHLQISRFAKSLGDLMNIIVTIEEYMKLKICAWNSALKLPNISKKNFFHANVPNYNIFMKSDVSCPTIVALEKSNWWHKMSELCLLKSIGSFCRFEDRAGLTKLIVSRWLGDGSGRVKKFSSDACCPTTVWRRWWALFEGVGCCLWEQP